MQALSDEQQLERLEKKVDDGFAGIEEEFRDVRAEMRGLRAEVRAEIGGIHQTIHSMWLTMVLGFAGLFLTMVLGLGGILLRP